MPQFAQDLLFIGIAGLVFVMMLRGIRAVLDRRRRGTRASPAPQEHRDD